MPYGKPLEVPAATASTRSTPLSRLKAIGSPVWASTAGRSNDCRGQFSPGSRGATTARRCACTEPCDAASIPSRAAAPILRRMSAASSAAAMIALVLAMMSAAGPFGRWPRPDPTEPGRCRGGAERMSASSWVGSAPAIWAAAVDPADVPMIGSASVMSNPASNRPAMTPISHALPVEPAPPRTSARSPPMDYGRPRTIARRRPRMGTRIWTWTGTMSTATGRRRLVTSARRSGRGRRR